MITTPVEISVPDFTACFRYVDVIDVQGFKQKYPGLDVKQLENMPSMEEFTVNLQKIQATVKIEDILLLTPQADKVISGCSVKEPRDFGFQDYLTSEQCNKHFVIWKFYLQEYICYRFKRLMSQDQIAFQYRLVSYAIDRAGVLYSIKISDEHIIKARYLKAVIHSSNRNPIAALAMTTNIKRRFDDEHKLGSSVDDVNKNYYIFELTYSQLNTTRLRPPFDTGCKNYMKEASVLSAMECRNECLVNKTTVKLGKLPFSVSLWNISAIIQHITRSGDVSDETNDYLSEIMMKEGELMSVLKYQHLTNDDLRNESISRQLIEVEEECHEICNKPDCEDIITLTRGSYDYIRPENVDNPSKQGLEFEISVPKRPVIAIIYKEKISITEFLVYVLSCFGIWFGLSVLSVNPFRLTLSLAEKSGSSLLAKNLLKRFKSKKLSSDYGGDTKYYNNRNQPKDYCLSMRMSVQKEIQQEIEAVKQSLFFPSSSSSFPAAATESSSFKH